MGCRVASKKTPEGASCLLNRLSAISPAFSFLFNLAVGCIVYLPGLCGTVTSTASESSSSLALPSLLASTPLLVCFVCVVPFSLRPQGCIPLEKDPRVLVKFPGTEEMVCSVHHFNRKQRRWSVQTAS